MVTALATSARCDYNINRPKRYRNRLENKYLKYHRNVLPIPRQWQKIRVIRCRFIFSGKNDELTPDFLDHLEKTLPERVLLLQTEKEAYVLEVAIDLLQAAKDAVISRIGVIGAGQVAAVVEQIALA